MELLNHLVAANLMKTAEMFERIGQHAPRHRPARPRLALVVDRHSAAAATCPHGQDGHDDGQARAGARLDR